MLTSIVVISACEAMGLRRRCCITSRVLAYPIVLVRICRAFDIVSPIMLVGCRNFFEPRCMTCGTSVCSPTRFGAACFCCNYRRSFCVLAGGVSSSVPTSPVSFRPGQRDQTDHHDQRQHCRGQLFLPKLPHKKSLHDVGFAAVWLHNIPLYNILESPFKIMNKL